MKIRFKYLIYNVIVLLLISFGACKPDSNLGDEPAKPFVRLLTNQSMPTKIFNATLKYSVLLPKDYDSTTKSYPVVYLLHGYGDNNSAWYSGGNLQFYVDYYASESIPMIYVMPDGFNSYYVNKFNGNYPYMDMFVNELVPTIDSIFRTIKDPACRAVMGYSMGGYGALILPAKNPNVFKTSVVLSMSFRTDAQYMSEAQSGWNSQWGAIFGGTGMSGSQRLTDYYKINSPFHFYANSALNGVNLYLDCGDDEETLSETNGELHCILRDLNIPHQYRGRDGAHTWSYWDSALPEALKYISLAAQKITYPTNPASVVVGTAVSVSRINAETLAGTSINFNVVVPEGYASSTSQYPLIVALHDNAGMAKNDAAQQLYSLLNTNMGSNRLQASLIVEIPLQAENITTNVIQQIINQIKTKYRTIDDRNHRIILGNNLAGNLAYESMTSLLGMFNSCLLFDANLPEKASSSLTDCSYWLDICDEGLAYKGYQSLYLSLRKNKIKHQYRVRQGTPSHQTFINGLSETIGFINEHVRI